MNTNTWARSAAGAFFVRTGAAGDEVLLVHKMYALGWDIPGGYVGPSEAPAQACRPSAAAVHRVGSDTRNVI